MADGEMHRAEARGYTLWRDDLLVGHLHVIFPSSTARGVFALLYPTAEYTDIEPLMQHRMSHVPHRPILQDRIPAIEAGQRRRNSSSVALRALSAEELREVDASRLLELRDDDGRPLELESLLIGRFEEREIRGEVRDACERLGVGLSAWYVMARLSPG